MSDFTEDISGYGLNLIECIREMISKDENENNRVYSMSKKCLKPVKNFLYLFSCVKWLRFLCKLKIAK